MFECGGERSEEQIFMHSIGSLVGEKMLDVGQSCLKFLAGFFDNFI